MCQLPRGRSFARRPCFPLLRTIQLSGAHASWFTHVNFVANVAPDSPNAWPVISVQDSPRSQCLLRAIKTAVNTRAITVYYVRGSTPRSGAFKRLSMDVREQSQGHWLMAPSTSSVASAKRSDDWLLSTKVASTADKNYRRSCGKRSGNGSRVDLRQDTAVRAAMFTFTVTGRVVTDTLTTGRVWKAIRLFDTLIDIGAARASRRNCKDSRYFQASSRGLFSALRYVPHVRLFRNDWLARHAVERPAGCGAEGFDGCG